MKMGLTQSSRFHSVTVEAEVELTMSMELVPERLSLCSNFIAH